jgi:hypothetical protein
MAVPVVGRVGRQWIAAAAAASITLLHGAHAANAAEIWASMTGVPMPQSLFGMASAAPHHLSRSV